MEEIKQLIVADDAERLDALLSALDKVKKLILQDGPDDPIDDPIGSQLASRLFGKEVRPSPVGLISGTSKPAVWERGEAFACWSNF
jgi:hypothetical protein